jgi:molybdate transport system substrate-binding protein
MLRRMIVNPLAWLIIAIAAACSTPAGPTPVGSVATDTGETKSVTVFAAASLTDAFQDIARRFEASYPGSQVIINFAGSQRLALMLEQGATADVFASADQRSMDRLVATGLVQRDAPSIFARNQLVVILPVDNPGRIQALEDLARPDLRLILTGEQVPAGAYARQVLENLAADPVHGVNFKDAVLRNVVSNEENVKQVVAKVRLGEADAGIVYQSDVTSNVADELRQIDVPDRFNITADYPIAVLGSAPSGDLARQFVQFVLAPEGQIALERWGFMGFHQ